MFDFMSIIQAYFLKRINGKLLLPTDIPLAFVKKLVLPRAAALGF